MYSLLKEWNTYSAEEKKNILFPFLNHVKTNLGNHLYREGVDVKEDLELAKVKALLCILF